MKFLVKVFFLGIVMISSICLHAQVTGEKILEDCIEVTGGKGKYEKIKNYVTKSTYELASIGLKIKITHYNAFPNLSYSLAEYPNGKVESGFDGETAWEKSILGARIKEDDEKWVQANFSRIDFVMKWREILKEVRLDREDIFEGQPCYVVTMIPKQGPPITSYYSKISKLIISANIL